MENAVSIDQVLDSAMPLPPEQLEMLLGILYKRQLEARREEIALGVKESIAAYRTGRLKAQSAEDTIKDLRQVLEEGE